MSLKIVHKRIRYDNFLNYIFNFVIWQFKLFLSRVMRGNRLEKLLPIYII